jgi:L-asparagine transporter-like permease
MTAQAQVDQTELIGRGLKPHAIQMIAISGAIGVGPSCERIKRVC